MTNNAITIDQVSKIYANNYLALKSVSLTIPKGEFFGLLGPNGAGKTTLIGILTTLVKKSSGTVTIFDKDQDKDPEGAKAHIGFVPQEMNFNVFEGVKQVLVQQAGFYGVGKKAAEKQARNKLQQLGLYHMRNRAIMELSGGMKRRLMIARALVHDPDILILDEPTAGVDLEIRHTLWELITNINKQGVTVILTTHYLEEAENLCRQIAIINNGEIVENTSTQKLLDQQYQESYILTFTSPVSCLSLPDFNHHKLDNGNFEVTIDSNQTMSQLFEQLNSLGIAVKRISRRKSRLEELFISLTGS
jgi:ABC-2 type transport system ATP-binding protein